MDRRIEKKISLRILGIPLFTLASQVLRRQVPTAPPGPDDSGEAATRAQTSDDSQLFVINSMMLHECFRTLTRTDDEDLILLTGSCVDHLRCLERIVPVALSRKSIAGAAADDGSLAGQLIELHEFGARPLAYFHSHPGNGSLATYPSGTDKHTQSAMEDSGGDVIGGIFSRDGFVRFYGYEGEPNVKVLGNKVTQVGHNLYRLEIEEDLQV